MAPNLKEQVCSTLNGPRWTRQQFNSSYRATAYHHKKSINYYLLSTEARASSTGALAPV